jgi:hypothetical protein
MSKSKIDEEKIRPLEIRWSSLIIIFFTLYAILRYIIFKGVDPVHFPVYIMNKVFSSAGLFFLALSYTLGKINGRKGVDKKEKNALDKKCRIAWVFVICHARSHDPDDHDPFLLS